MRELLLRDWKLYRFTLILPFGFCLLWAFLMSMVIAYLRFPSTPSGRAMENLLSVLTLAAAPVMAGLRVQGLHLLEISNGTLQDLAALPVPRRSFLWLRLLEGILLTLCLFVPILATAGWMLHILGSSHHLLPTQPLNALAAFGWILLAFLLLPLPFNFRWGLRGLLWLGLGLLAALTLGTSLPAFSHWILKRFPGTFPGQAALLLLLGGSACGLSMLALQRRES